MDQCEVADLDEFATVDFRSQSKSERGTLGMDQCEQLTRDRRISLEIAESPAQLEVGDFSISIGGQRQKSRHWPLGQKRWQCSVLCDSLIGKEKSLEGKTLVEVASQGPGAETMESEERDYGVQRKILISVQPKESLVGWPTEHCWMRMSQMLCGNIVWIGVPWLRMGQL